MWGTFRSLTFSWLIVTSLLTLKCVQIYLCDLFCSIPLLSCQAQSCHSVLISALKVKIKTIRWSGHGSVDVSCSDIDCQMFKHDSMDLMAVQTVGLKITALSFWCCMGLGAVSLVIHIFVWFHLLLQKGHIQSTRSFGIKFFFCCLFTGILEELLRTRWLIRTMLLIQINLITLLPLAYILINITYWNSGSSNLYGTLGESLHLLNSSRATYSWAEQMKVVSLKQWQLGGPGIWPCSLLISKPKP